MASLDLPLSTEPNLGVWKVMARAGKRTAQLDVRVERYVLPKYEVKVTLPKEWVAGQRARSRAPSAPSTPTASRSRARSVVGAAATSARWEEYANVTRPIDGTAQFDLPAVQYVGGVPGSGGLGNVSSR